MKADHLYLIFWSVEAEDFEVQYNKDDLFHTTVICVYAANVLSKNTEIMELLSLLNAIFVRLISIEINFFIVLLTKPLHVSASLVRYVFSFMHNICFYSLFPNMLDLEGKKKHIMLTLKHVDCLHTIHVSFHTKCYLLLIEWCNPPHLSSHLFPMTSVWSCLEQLSRKENIKIIMR